MKIEILSIGDELLKGATVNTNATFISKELFQAGYGVARQTVLADDAAELRCGLNELLTRNDVVISTGGLGPTLDDITRKVVADYYGVDFRYDAAVAEDLKKRYGEQAISVADQASVPSSAKIMPNRLGTAPGLIFDQGPCTLFLLPGVPVEMEALMREGVLPYLREHLSHSQRKVVRSCYFFGLSEAVIDPAVRMIARDLPSLEIGIYPSFGTVAVHFSLPDKPENLPALEAAQQKLLAQFGEHAYNSPSGKLEEAVHNLLIAKGFTLATAESCTGGNIASRLTQLPNASRYYAGSIICYSNQMKIDLLDVSPSTLQKHGAVSEEVVKEMALGLLNKCHTDFGVAITGIAGPDGGSAVKPVGMMWGAVIHKGMPPLAWSFHRRGNRKMIIEGASNAILAKLLAVASK